MVQQDAFDLVVNNMRETPSNNKKTFARYMKKLELGEFEQLLMETWFHANDDNQERLAIAFPQVAHAILEYYTLPEKKREKYLNKLMGD